MVVGGVPDAVEDVLQVLADGFRVDPEEAGKGLIDSWGQLFRLDSDFPGGVIHELE